MNAEPAPILSICIATLNRAAYIGETLSSIAAQFCDGVEVVILDGASTDNTEQVVRSFEGSIPRLHYHRQAKNSGVDADFDRAVELASGKYCWLMSDDDLLRADAIQSVLRKLRDEPSLVVVNAEVRSNDFSRLFEERRLPMTSDRQYGPGEMDQLFADAGSYLTFIACVVIRRDLWLARERARYYGSLFIHVGVIFQAPLPATAVIISEPLISIRYGNAMWRPKEFEIWMFKWPSLVWSLPAVSATAKRVVTDDRPWHSAKLLLFYRAKGTYSLTEYRVWLAARLAPRKKVMAAAIALFPGVLANAMGLFYCSFVHRGTGMALLELRNSRYHIRNLLAASNGA
jgi:Glycosyltransferases involved in cell wall biogenesis|nr:glycosyltransferase family 2 protein [uncultured Steroidobacter sp.]